MNLSDPSLPNYVRPEAVKVRPDLDLVADLLGGTRRMWEESAAKKYIRKWKDEAQEVYDLRRQSETVFEGLGRVLSACVGMLFARVPDMEWNASETAMSEQYANLDAAGTAGAVLCKRFADKALRDGIGIILVDHPPAPLGEDGKPVTVTAANEAELGLRPTWAIYQRAQAINWFDDVVKNRRTLTQLTLEETATVREDLYGVRPVKRYRDLRMIVGPEGDVATWKLWEETREAGVGGFKPAGGGTFTNRAGEAAKSLPVAIAYTGRTDAPMTATIPLLGVAWANLAHWQTSTDLRFAEMIAAYAQPVICGELMPEPLPNGGTRPGRIKLGPLVALQLQAEGKFSWEAPPVEAFASLEKAIAEKLQQIGQMGMQFLVADTRAAETAEAKRLDATAENSTLATAGQGIEDAWNAALEIDAWYLGIEKAGAPVLTINKDFDSVALDAQTMAVYVAAVRDAGLPVRLLLEAWQGGGRIPPDTDLEELEAEMMANAAAAQAEKERQQEEQVAVLRDGAQLRAAA